MFEVAQIYLHTLAIPSLWDEVLQLIMILSILELEGTHEGCARGTLLLLKLVIMIVVLCEMFLNPFHRNIYVGGNPVYQSTFHCRLILELSLLHQSHHVWELNQNRTPLPTHGTIDNTACFELPKGHPLSNPIKT